MSWNHPNPIVRSLGDRDNIIAHYSLYLGTKFVVHRTLYLTWLFLYKPAGIPTFVANDSVYSLGLAAPLATAPVGAAGGFVGSGGGRAGSTDRGPCRYSAGSRRGGAPRAGRRRRSPAPKRIDQRYRYEFLEPNSDVDSEPGTSSHGDERATLAVASDQGPGPPGFAGTAAKAGAQRPAGLTTLADDTFDGGPTVPMVPGSWHTDPDQPDIPARKLEGADDR